MKVSHGDVVLHLRYDKIFNHQLIANLLLSLNVHKFWKLVNIWPSYRQEFSVPFFWLTG